MSASHGAKRATKPTLMRVNGLCKQFVQSRSFARAQFVVDALQDVHMQIHPECVTALVGDSGSGKSTLAACLAMLERADEGEIWFEDREISRLTDRDLAWLRPKIQLVFQDSAGALNPRFSAAQVVAEPFEVQRLASGKELRQRVCQLMEEVGLSPESADRPSRDFSGGQRQRLAIARAIALQPQLLILDESLSGLDLVTQAQILNLMSDIQRSRSFACLWISHDLSLVGQVADHVAVMHRGRIVEQGTREEIFAHPQHGQTRSMLSVMLNQESAFRATQPGIRS